MIGTADDDHQLTVEEFHRGLLEGFQTRGIAIADGLKGACASDLKRQLVGCLRDEGAVGIGQGDSDEGEIVARGF